MDGFVSFLIVAAIAYWWFLRRGKSMAGDMGKLIEQGVEIDAKVVGKDQPDMAGHAPTSRRYLIYAFTLENGQSFSKKISPDFELWDALNEGDSIRVVYLTENPEISAIKETVETVRAAMSPKS